MQIFRKWVFTAEFVVKKKPKKLVIKNIFLHNMVVDIEKIYLPNICNHKLYVYV